MNNKVYVIMYHYVRDLGHSRYPKIKGLDTNYFRQQIQYLKSNFNIVCMQDVIEAYDGQIILPEKSVLLTFDDGYIDHYTTVFPILKAEKLEGSFFIPGKTIEEHKLLDVNKIHFILANADIKRLIQDVLDRMNYYRGEEYYYPQNDDLFSQYAVSNRFDNKETIFVKRMLQIVLPEKVRNKICSDLFEQYVGISEEKLAYELYLTKDQIKLMRKDGMYIGLHGYDHYWLGNLPEEEMRADINKALSVMDEFIDSKSWVMNYPYGNYNEKLLQYITSCDCKLGLTTDARVTNLLENERFEIPRLDTNDFPPVSENFRRLER